MPINMENKKKKNPNLIHPNLFLAASEYVYGGSVKKKKKKKN